MSGYTRQSAADIIPNNVVQAGPLNNEFNALQAAFSNVTGHAHDGSSGNGPRINLLTSVVGALPIANGGTGQITASLAFDALKQDAGENYKGVVEKAELSDVFTAVDDKFLSADHIEDANAWVTLTYTANLTPNFANFINARMTLTGGTGIANPTNGIDGVARRLLFKGNNTTERTVAFNGDKFIGPLPEDPVSSIMWLDVTITPEGDNFLVDYIYREI